MMMLAYLGIIRLLRYAKGSTAVKVGYGFDSMGLGFLLALIIINSYLQVSKAADLSTGYNVVFRREQGYLTRWRVTRNNEVPL